MIVGQGGEEVTRVGGGKGRGDRERSGGMMRRF